MAMSAASSPEILSQPVYSQFDWQQYAETSHLYAGRGQNGGTFISVSSRSLFMYEALRFDEPKEPFIRIGTVGQHVTVANYRRHGGIRPHIRSQPCDLLKGEFC